MTLSDRVEAVLLAIKVSGLGDEGIRSLIASHLKDAMREAADLARAPVTHELKCWPVYYQAILAGIKAFDIRNGSDRHYKIGDLLNLREWDPDKKAYTGNSSVRRVTYVMHGPPLLPPDTWVLSLDVTLGKGSP